MKRTAKLVSLILALVMVAALFAGCGGETQEQAGQQTAAPTPTPNVFTEGPAIANTSDEHELTEETKYADEVIFGYPDVGAVFTPLNANSAGQISQIAYLMIYNTLLSRDPNKLDGYLPELATEWGPNEDYTVWTCKLRDDVKFHNGEPFTADDVLFTYEAFMEVPGSTGALKFGEVTEVEVLGDYEVAFHLEKPNVEFEDNLANHGTLIMNREAVEADPELGPRIGTGVWKFDDFKANTYLTLVPNENTWEKPAISKRFTMKTVTEVTSKCIMFENGELDYINDVPAQYLAKYEADPNVAFDQFASISTNYCAFNMNSPIGGDKNFRYACAYAVDMEAVNAIATQGTGTGYKSLAYWGRGTAYQKEFPYEQDLEKAKEYLAQSSYVPGTEVQMMTLSSGIHADVAQVIQQQLSEIGINVNIFATDNATMMANSNWGSTSYDMLVFGGPWQIQPSSCFFTMQTGLIGNKAQFSNARVDELLRMGASTPNGPERQAIYEEVQDILAEEIPYLGTVNPNVTYGRHANCGGVIFFPDGVFDFTYVYKIVEE